jgi:hypothetical protein
MLIAAIACCSQVVSVSILLRAQAMLIEAIARCSQVVSVSILLRAHAMLIEANCLLFAGCECVDPPSSSSYYAD